VTESLNRIQDDAVEALKRWLNGPEDRKTENLRATAQNFVAAREHFTNPAGDPDWLGRSFAYRSWVRDTMTRAGVPTERVSGTLTSIRYHAGNALRERLPAEELADLGLLTTSPLKRAQAQNDRKSELLQVLDGGARLDTSEAITSALRAVESILRRVDLPTIAGLAKDDADAVAVASRAVRVIAESVAETAAGHQRSITMAADAE